LAFALTFASALKELIRPSRLGGEPRPVGGESPDAGGAGAAEDFEHEPLTRWELIGSPPPAIGAAGDGRALLCSGTAYGVLGGVSVSDLALQFRYRQGAGVGEVVLRGRPEWRDSSVWGQHYRVCFRPDRIALVKKSGSWPARAEEELASTPLPVPVGAWRDVAIRAAGNRIEVSLGGRVVLSADDPASLPAGAVAFGCASGSDFAYDDVRLRPVR
jgi:hypothetical protein